MIGNEQIIQISRSKYIEASRQVAALRLNTRGFRKGELVMLNYYKNRDFRDDIGVLIAIGVRDGVGEDKYKIINSGGEVHVRSVVVGEENYPDVSNLVDGELYIAQGNNGVWNYIYKEDSEVNRTITPIPENAGPFIFLDLESGYRWFYNKQKCKREDDFFSVDRIEEILGTISDLDARVSVTSEQGYIFKKGTRNDLNLEIHVYNGRGEDITTSCDIYLDDTKIELYDNHKYLLRRVYKDRDYAIEARIFITEGVWAPFRTTMSVRFGYDIFYGIVGDDWNKDPKTLENKQLSYRRSILWEGINLNQQTLAFCYPKEYGYLAHVFDVHGLDYIYDYKIYDNGTVIDEVPYLIYLKSDKVSISDLEQTYVFDDTNNLEVEEDNILNVVSAWKKRNRSNGLVVLGGDGKIAESLYDKGDANVEFKKIKAFVTEDPTEGMVAGEIYYNTRTNTVFTAIDEHEGTISDPNVGDLYLYDGEFFSWNGREFSSFSRSNFAEITNITEVSWLK